MDPRFAIYNTHISAGIDYFCQNDPQLSALQNMPYAYTFPMAEKLPTETPGIYTLGGSRQIGKSTLLKQWMKALMLENNVLPNHIVFLTGDIIDDHHQLLQILMQILGAFSKDKLAFIIIDEITYIKDWDKCIKFLADSGQLRNIILMLSGSDLAMIKEARMRFPGRRGGADIVDFHLYPLSFHEYCQLTSPELIETDDHALLLSKFNHYLQHGGYLTAINDLAQFGIIRNATITTYSDWIRGDMLKRGKQETYVRELFSGIIKQYTSQITWNSLAKELSIDHHKTIADYVECLCDMDALFVQHALQEDKLAAAPKKAKKVFFTDPFVFHATNAWLNPVENIYQTQIVPATEDPIRAAQLVETVVINYFRQHYPTYYIKAEGEVDVAYINQGKFWPIEIKWRNQMRPKEFKQIKKYKHAEIWAKYVTSDEIEGVKTRFLPEALIKMKHND